MGIGKATLDFLTKSASRTVGSFSGMKMVELGDQKLHPNVQITASGERIWAKDLFEQMGCHHYSIDWHGKNGAYPLDLSRPIEDKFWLERFDVLTNFGTAEHVSNQYECWRNIHNLVRPGGLFVHFLPVEWPSEHCDYFYDSRFVFNLAIDNKYDIVFLETFKGTLISKRPCKTIHVSLLKPRHTTAFMPDEKKFLSWIRMK